MSLQIDRLDSPIGAILAVSDGAALCALEFEDCRDRMAALLRARHGADRPLVEAADPLGLRACLRAYFAGDLTALDGVPVDGGGTPFQQRVWAALRAIPAGTTLTYGGLAARLGKPAASRAVGLANALNPISIVVPCHRLIGAGGDLTGYGGGLERKRWLLAHEGVRLPVPKRGPAAESARPRSGS